MMGAMTTFGIAVGDGVIDLLPNDDAIAETPRRQRIFRDRMRTAQ